MALGMFLGIPLPFHVWDEKLTTVMVATLPLVGLVVGAIWWGVAVLLMLPSFPIVIVAALVTVAPFFIAGFIHLDGYMDTSDALYSWRPLEDRLRILEDSLVGAFAVVMLAILFLLQFAAVFTIVSSGRFLALFIVITILSRSLAAFCMFALKHNKVSHYLNDMKSISGKIFVLCIALAAIGFAVFYAGPYGLIVCGAVIIGYGWAMRKVHKAFEGISGDLLGFSIVISELCGLVALALIQGVEIGLWF